MVYAVGVVHPEGEAELYDGLYLKTSEMEDFAKTMRGLPLYVEHDTANRVGTVHHCWQTPGDQLSVLFSTDDTVFGGHLASNLIKKGVCHELSLGHDCSIAHSAGGQMRVINKHAVEVSLVVKGAREHTQIAAWGHNPSEKREDLDLSGTPRPAQENNTSTEYIRRVKGSVSAQPTMTDTAPTTNEHTAVPSTTDDSAAPAVPSQPPSVMNELRTQTDINAAMQSKLQELQSQLKGYQQVGQKRRQEALDGAVKDWVKQILETHKSELGQYEGKYNEMFAAMTKNEEAEPMVQLLSCAAARSKASTAAYEEKYQAAQQENKRLRTQIQNNRPAFAEPQERFAAPPAPAPTPAPDAYSRMFSSSSSSSTTGARGGGMRTVNPGMWGAMMNRASAMPDGGSKQTFDTSLFSEQRRAKLGW